MNKFELGDKVIVELTLTESRKGKVVYVGKNVDSEYKYLVEFKDNNKIILDLFKPQWMSHLKK